MMFINTTESIGIVLCNATTITTGSIFITLLLCLVILCAFALMFGIRLEYTSIIVLPLLFAYAAYYSEYIGVLGVVLIYLALIFTGRFILK